jgi:hypothetical protein
MLLRKFKSFLIQPLFIQIWLLPVWILLGISKVLIFTVPFRRLAHQLGTHTGVAPWLPLLTSDQVNRARAIERVVKMAARYTFWNANCFPQAITARWLLELYNIPYTLFFGLARDTSDKNGMKAHAWVAAGPIRVTGGYSFGQFTVVGCFASNKRDAAQS